MRKKVLFLFLICSYHINALQVPWWIGGFWAIQAYLARTQEQGTDTSQKPPAPATVSVTQTGTSATITGSNAEANVIKVVVGPELTDAAKSVQQAVQRHSTSVITTIKNNMLTIGISSAASVLTGVFGYEVYLHRYLAHQDRWIHWSRTIPTARLRSGDETHMYAVLCAIEERYAMTTDKQDPLLRFLQEAQQELQLLMRYERIIGLLKRVHLDRLLWFKPYTPEQLTEMKERISALRSIIFEWMDERRLALKKRIAHRG